MSKKHDKLVRGKWGAFLSLRNDNGEHMPYPRGFINTIATHDFHVGTGFTGYESISFIVFNLNGNMHGFEPSTVEPFADHNSPTGYTLVRYADLMFNHWFDFPRGGWNDTGCRVRPDERLHYVLSQAYKLSGIVAEAKAGATHSQCEMLYPSSVTTRSGPVFLGKKLNDLTLVGFDLSEAF